MDAIEKVLDLIAQYYSHQAHHNVLGKLVSRIAADFIPLMDADDPELQKAVHRKAKILTLIKCGHTEDLLDEWTVVHRELVRLLRGYINTVGTEFLDELKPWASHKDINIDLLINDMVITGLETVAATLDNRKSARPREPMPLEFIQDEIRDCIKYFLIVGISEHNAASIELPSIIPERQSAFEAAIDCDFAELLKEK